MNFIPFHAGSRQRKLWQFHGGLHLPDEKTLSNTEPAAPLPLPSQLVIPLQQHIGTPARACVAVGDRVRTGQVIGEPQGPVSAPVHASTSGVVTAIEPRAVPHPSGLQAPCVIIDADGLDQWAELPPPIPAFKQTAADDLRQRIRQSGIVGMGGASFPADVKLAPGGEHPVETLIINGAECEPYITCDDRLMREHAADIIDGVHIMLHILDARRCLVGIEDNKPEAIAAMRQAVSAAGLERLIEVVCIPTLYPSGGEKQLIRILTGKEVPSHDIPARIGLLVQNVGTAMAVADAVLRGRPLIERLVTVSGRGVAHPRNFRVRIGTPAAALVAASGGYRPDQARLVIGGPMMGYAVESDAIPVTKSLNCVLALTSAESPDPGPAQPCIRCGRCAEVCPARLLPQQLYWHARAKDLDKVQDYNLFDCIECGCCALVCPSHIPLVQYYRYAKTESWAREREKQAAEHARQRHAAREARLQRLERERQARLRQKKAAAPAKATAAGAKAGARTGAKTGAVAGTKTASQHADRQAAIEAARKRAAERRQAKAATADPAASPPPTANAGQETNAGETR
ncbi:electron transport complex subunit RsxC [Thiohalocapsa marina]|uniref:Ion-translocating oxidoreductase complex subunit C n=1 Tax=Thiohalocapsa marina TaxID=424902 RepID=A0A5M8FK31_9GAMM|nr:electron transport complex subunit RsxC [Thiohalocapsa marina]KAA6184086.1 electron transport complex subunit RsxC [Thiohalocapsa marina]